MPIKVKNKLNGQIVDTVVENWYNGIFSSNKWELVYQKDVFLIKKEVNCRWELVGYHELESTDKMIDNHKNYVCERLPDLDLLPKGNLLPTKTPKAYAAINKGKIIISKYKDNIWIVTIVGGLIVLILGTWILKKAGII